MPTPRQYRTNADRQRAYRRRQQQARTEEMQSKGLPASSPISTMPSLQRWTKLLDHAKTTLETLRDEMQEYHDDRTEEWQESDRAEALQARIEAIEEALNNLAEAE